MESKENVFFDSIILSMLGEEEVRDEILKPGLRLLRTVL